MRRRIRALLAMAAVTVGLAVALPSGPVSAHAALEQSTPAPSSVLTSSPPDIVLDFDEAVDPGTASIQLFDAEATPIELGAAAAGADDSVITVTVPTLDDGLYAVVWRVTSVDGHTVDGAFSFQIGTSSGGDAGSLIDSVVSGTSASPAVGRVADIGRFLAFLGIVLLVGAGAFALAAPRSLGDGAATRVILWAGWVALVVGTALAFAMLGAAAVAGSVADGFTPSVWGKAADLSTGTMQLLRLVLAVGAAVLLRLRARRDQAWWRVAAVVAALALVLTFSASGHPRAVSPAALWIGLDVVHLVAISLWMGALVLFMFGGRAWLRDDEAAPTVRRFSALATVLVPVIVATGAAQTWKLAGGTDGVRALTDSTWGRTLLIKLSVVAALVALGAVSRWLLQQAGHTSLRRTVAAEAMLGVAVLALTAGLVSESPSPVAPSKVFNAAVTQAGLLADITVTPGRVGSNEIHVVLTPPGSSITPVSGVTARMSLPSREIPDVPVTLELDGRNHATGSVTLPFPGDWTLEVIVEVTPGSTVLVSTTVPIP